MFKHKLFVLPVCLALAALWSGVASATSVTLTFEGDIVCYLDQHDQSSSVWSTYQDATMEVVLDLDDPWIINGPTLNGQWCTVVDGDGTVVSATWRDSAGEVITDLGMGVVLDKTYEEMQAEYTYDTYSRANSGIGLYQDLYTGECIDGYAMVSARMSGLEWTDPGGMPFFGVNFFDLRGNDSDTSVVGEWRIGDWLFDLDYEPDAERNSRFEERDFGGYQLRYVFDGELTGIEIEGVQGLVVPEPASAALAMMGLAALAARRWRRRR